MPESAEGALEGPSGQWVPIRPEDHLEPLVDNEVLVFNSKEPSRNGTYLLRPDMKTMKRVWS